jgi:hypothetical protein
MSEREWTSDAELLARALEAGSGPSWGGYQSPDANVVTIDGAYDATAVLNFIRAADRSE